MTETKSIRELQKKQKEHDRGYHEDIQSMPYMDRTNHFVLHFSKYVGRLSREYPGDLKEEQLKKTLADSFIVCLATANTLEVDLQEELNETTGGEDAQTLAEWGALLDPHDTLDEDIQGWLLRELADPTGRMANALESLDHMEPVPYRETIEESLVEIVVQLLLAGTQVDPDLGRLVEDRWQEIEDNAIL